MEMHTVTVEQSRKAQLGYGMARLGLFGGGGGMSSESGSGGRFRFWTPWAQRSTYCKRMSFVTGSWMLLHTAGKNRHRKEVTTEMLMDS